MSEQPGWWPFAPWSGMTAPQREARIARLCAVGRQVEQIMQAHAADLVESAERAMPALAESDPRAVACVAAAFAGRKPAA
jgi:hypothetical protein